MNQNRIAGGLLFAVIALLAGYGVHRFMLADNGPHREIPRAFGDHRPVAAKLGNPLPPPAPKFDVNFAKLSPPDAPGDRKFSIVLTSDVKGELEPCG